MTSDWLVWQLADSALPTGGFAHSYGLEAAWQHGEVVSAGDLRSFVRATLLQVGRGVLPLATSAYRTPDRYADLDALGDAFLTNHVANRASRVQGRTLAATCARIWPTPRVMAVDREVRRHCAHVGPVTGVVFAALGVPLWVTQKLLLYGTSRSVISAAVRLGLVGSYEGQRLRADAGRDLDEVLAWCADLEAEEVEQPSPLIDLWQGTHDRLYSRLFQS